jgi:ATP-dependent Clp protease adapter protein ClpS
VPVNAEAVWRVVIHNDHVNSLVVVVHLVQTLCAMAVEEALRLGVEVDRRGSAEVAAFPGQGEAEELVVAFQRRGVHATARHA